MRRSDQAGIVSLVAAVLLVAGVLVVILLTTGVIRSRSIDTARTSDSEAALMLAESGLERAQLVISNAVTSAATSDTTCTGLLTDGPFSIGRGTLSYSSAVSSPANCGTTTACDGCSVTAKGVVGSTERDLSLNVEYGFQDGVTGRGTTVKMALKNIYSTDAIALFNLAWRRQGTGGNASSTLTTSAGTLMWNLNSSSGLKSAGGMGTAVPISANTYSQIVTQTLDYSRDYTEVGGLFPGLSSAPTRLNAYWSDGTEGAGATQKTYANNGSTTGSVLAGVATSSTSSCVTPSSSNGMNAPGNNGDYQSTSCTSWCYGGDTLIMGISARSTTVADQTTAAHFDTSGGNYSMSSLVHYPNTDGTTANASGEEYSEIYYLYNPPYNSSSDPANSRFSGAGATSYNAAAYAQSTGSSTTVSINPKMTAGQTSGHISGYSGGTQICVGDVVSDSKLPSGTKVTAVPGGGSCSSANGTVTLDHGVTSGNVTSFVIAPRQIKVTSGKVTSSTGNLATGSTTVLNSDGTTLGTISIASGPDASNVYTLSSAPSFSFAGNFVVQGTSGSTIRVASASDLPDSTKTTWTDASGGTHNTLYRVWGYDSTLGGTGAISASAYVSSVDTTNKTFTMSSSPTTPLVGATICAGTCAYFNTPSSTSTLTSFSITPSSGTKQWSVGFMCLKNVDSTKIQKITSTAIKSRGWNEAVQ